ncbi:MAG: M3 family oligoendopeptidase [Myxococcales bacterium]|nr:M3 family oligoendopeptidase [Myxococcales bacterium]
MEAAIDLSPPPRAFVPSGLLVERWGPFEALYERLAEARPESPDALLRWLHRWSELKSVIAEEGTRRMVATSLDTADEAASSAYLEFIRVFAPKVSEWDNRLERAYCESPHRAALRARGLEQLDRILSINVELFDERNIPLQVQASELVHAYDEITGGWIVRFEGREHTIQEMAKYLQDADRARRARAFEATARVRLADRDRLDDRYDALLGVRGAIAENLGLPDYRAYSFREMLREYTPEDCETFHAAIERAAVPLLAELYESRRRRLGVDRLEPWDLQVDPEGRAPLRPFEAVPELLDRVAGLFTSLDARLGRRFEAIRPYMDLESRKGKAPGGFQATFQEQRRPFIFANLVGVHDDISTLVHESGHAFHCVEGRSQDLVWLTEPAMEFCEVSSMSQELLILGRLDAFYSDPDARRRAAVSQWESAVQIFCWVGVIDAFQHWIYTNPGHGREERRAKFTELYRRFIPVIDWSGAPGGTLENYWQRQLHLYHVPFYYIEYAIAELGALQVYRNFRRDPAEAVTKLLEAQRLGGRLGAPGLFEAAGIRFDLGPDLLSDLMAMAREELRELGEVQ